MFLQQVETRGQGRSTRGQGGGQLGVKGRSTRGQGKVKERAVEISKLTAILIMLFWHNGIFLNVTCLIES